MKAAIKPPHLPADDALSVTELTNERLEKNSRHENLLLCDLNFSTQLATGVSFDECHFQKVKFCGAQMSGVQVSDSRFDECDLANAIWTKATLTRLEMTGCRLLGLRANESDVQHLVVRDGTVSLAQFRFATFKSVRFEDCNLRGVDFHGADLRGVVFQGCDLKEAQMSSAKLFGTDFRGSDIEGMQIGPSDLGNLKGAIVEPVQAAYIAGQLGLHVKWSDSEE